MDIPMHCEIKLELQKHPLIELMKGDLDGEEGCRTKTMADRSV